MEMTNNRTFMVRFVTPVRSFEREVISLRLKDRSGYFGIMKGHRDFLTVLLPSLGMYRDRDNREVYLAVKGGILIVRERQVTLLSREITESGEMDSLSRLFQEETERKDSYEAAFQQTLMNMEKAYINKKVRTERWK